MIIAYPHMIIAYPHMIIAYPHMIIAYPHIMIITTKCLTQSVIPPSSPNHMQLLLLPIRIMRMVGISLFVK